MIKVQCDRCKREIEPKADIGYISWCFKQGVDGDLGENILEGQHFCERCMDRIMKIICNFDDEEQAERKRPYETPEIIEVKKRNTGCRLGSITKRRILELSEEGKNAKEIAEEMKMDYVKVKNCIYYERRKADDVLHGSGAGRDRLE